MECLVSLFSCRMETKYSSRRFKQRLDEDVYFLDNAEAQQAEEESEDDEVEDDDEIPRVPFDMDHVLKHAVIAKMARNVWNNITGGKEVLDHVIGKKWKEF